MGSSYSAGVFFGCFVQRRSKLGTKLNKYIDRHGGTPAETEVDRVEIGMVGCDGGRYLTVEAKGSDMSYGRDDGDCPAPVMLAEQPEWRPAVEEFLRLHGSDVAIGWHFYGSIW